MIFTSTTAPFRTSPSALFKEKGDDNGFPGTCEQSKIYGIPGSMSYGDIVSKAILPYVAIAGVIRAPHKVGAPYKIITADLPFVFPHPQVGLSFNKPKESTIEDLRNIGFIEDTHGRFRYCRIVSTFGAFGAQAPSFYDPLGTPLPIVSNNAENRKRYGAEQIFIHDRKAKGDLVLPNGKIPVFIKPVLTAVQDFRHMKGGHAVAYRYTPRGGVAGAAYVVEKASTDSIAKMLIHCFAPKKASREDRGTKRDRDDAGITEMNKEFDRPSKKTKETGGMWDFISLQEQLPGKPGGATWVEDKEASEDEEIS